VVKFGVFEVDLEAGELRKSGMRQKLVGHPFQVLQLLLERPQEIVTREEMQQRIWPQDTFVDYDLALRKAVNRLREVLGDDAESPRWIETIPRRGYRFIARVDENETAAASASEEATGITTKTEVNAGSLAVQTPTPPSISLKWIPIAALLPIVLAGFVLWRQLHSGRTASHPMLMVLPVQNLTGDSSREYLTDGLTEELIGQLGSLNPDRLAVIARTSSMAYKTSSKTVGQIGRELGVDYVLESSLRESPGEIRFTAQLIRTRDQTHLWAHTYDRPLADVLALQGELVRAIADEIRISLTPQQKERLSSYRPISPAAYDAFVQAQFHWNERSAKHMRLAIEFFQKAIAEDPDFAPAYVGLADSYAMLATMKEERPADMMPKAKDALLKALALDNSLAEAHTSLAWIMEDFDWDWSGSEKEFRKAIQLDPNDATAHHRYAFHLAAMGSLPQALSEMRLSQRLDPLSPVLMTSTGWVFLRGRLPDQALAECQKALDLDPKFVRGHLCLGEAYEEKHDLDRAASEFLTGKILGGDTPEVIDALKKATSRFGYAGYFRERLVQLVEKSKTSYVSPSDLANICVRLGDKEQALKWLDLAYEEHSPYLANLQIEPRLDPLRSDPRFQELVQHLGLAGIAVSRIDPLSDEQLSGRADD
jgi:TolB-like protein/DNA-binding winged helix-turn-helix (wHTH) protein/Tfp pilus assembly protein PilF